MWAARFAALVSVIVLAQAPPRYDLLIAGGGLVDGSGRAAVRGDLAIRAGRIAAVGRVSRGSAVETIDASGLIVAPGFINVDTHADDIADRPSASDYVRTGVTTVVAGNGGESALDVGA